jgi:hypothetical protein
VLAQLDILPWHPANSKNWDRGGIVSMTRDAAWFIAEAARREKPWEEKIED